MPRPAAPTSRPDWANRLIALAAVGALLVSAMSIRYTEESVNATQDQLHIAEQGQITERFARAVEQLGSDTVDVRLGGIYALERVMRDSPSDHPIVMEILAAFIREHAPRANTPAVDKFKSDGFDRPTTDVQAALTVLGRRNTQNDRPDDRLNLTGAYLAHAELNKADLTYADLSGADLTSADLTSANLSRALVVEADLSGADLTDARVDLANLGGANLTGTGLVHVDLSGANVSRANLTRAILIESDLTSAGLIEGNLIHADLTGANLSEADLSSADLGDATLFRARLGEASLTEANLTGAYLSDADLTDADLSNANLRGADLSYANLRGADFSGAVGLTIEQMVCAQRDASTQLNLDWPPCR